MVSSVVLWRSLLGVNWEGFPASEECEHRMASKPKRASGRVIGKEMLGV